MPDTLVIQSHQTPLPKPWLHNCLASVQDWSGLNRFEYRFLGNELFTYLPKDIAEKTRNSLLVATDLARLLVLRTALEEGFQCVIWCDADTLVFNPDSLVLHQQPFGLGRQVWIQCQHNKPKAYFQVHNAFMLFRADNSFLDFYIDSAAQLIRLNQGQFVPQFIGPKFLTALHNLVRCPVVETAGMLSPRVAKDLLKGGGPFLDMFQARCKIPPAALNLCTSLVKEGHISDEEIESIISLLIRLPSTFHSLIG